MGLQINTNIAAMNAYRNLSNTQGAMGKSLERLSSGLRINRAADDAAGLVISEKLGSQVNGIKVAMRNAQDGISVVQTADGALNETTAILQRMRDLAMHAANTGSTDATGAGADQAELATLNSEMDRIASTTQFGAQNLLDGTYAAKQFNIGATAAGGDLLSVTIDNGTANKGFGSTDLGTNALDLTTGAGATAAVSAIDSALDKVSASRGLLGATQNRLEHTINNLSVASENLSASQSRIRDTDMAQEMTTFTRSQILQQAGVSMLAQANSAPQSVLKLLG
jgi:flagellin